MQQQAIKPLSHVRVLDLSRVLAGPWCTQNLADLGAEVIKVERPDVGDETRGWGPPWLPSGDHPQRQDSAYYASTNRGKKSITVDLANRDGQDLIRRLVATCDVLVENYKVGTLARYGLAYDDLKKANPGLIYCSVTGFGQTGPYSHRPGYDFVFQGMAGLMSITGERDDLPGEGRRRWASPWPTSRPACTPAWPSPLPLPGANAAAAASTSTWLCSIARWPSTAIRR